MENQIVQSYVRYKKPKETKEPDMVVPTVLVGATLLVVMVLLWQVSVAVALVGGGWYASQRLSKTNTVLEAPVALETKKRHYNKRIVVNHYEHGKVSV